MSKLSSKYLNLTKPHMAWFALILCIWITALAAQTLPDAQCKISQARRPVTAETLFILRSFIDQDNPVVVDNITDLVSKTFATKESRTAYFQNYGSYSIPYDQPIVLGGDLAKLGEALNRYAVRASVKGNYSSKRTEGSPKVSRNWDNDAATALKSALDVAILLAALKPPETITIDEEYKIKIPGIYNFGFVTLPINTIMRSQQDALIAIEKSHPGSLGDAIKRVGAIRQRQKKFSQEQVKLLKSRKDWANAQQENEHSRAYAKLFEEELPILRRELTLLKADIDKGFAELQKQQDDKAKAAPKAKAKTTS